MLGKLFGANNKPLGIPDTARITLDVNFSTGLMKIRTDPALPLFTQANLFLMATSNFIAKIAEMDSMIVRPNNQPIEQSEGANDNGKKSNDDNKGNDGSGGTGSGGSDQPTN